MHRIIPGLDLRRAVRKLVVELALADATSVGKELLLKLLADPSLDNDVIGIVLADVGLALVTSCSWSSAYLVPIPRKMVGQQGFRQQVFSVGLRDVSEFS